MLSFSGTNRAPSSPASPAASPVVTPARVVIVTTVMLTFISFWRAAAVVLSDLASTAYYIGGIAEQAVGRSAPWFILGVMIFSYAVRSVYVESCSMFTRGGVYRIVREAMGGTMAKISVSALVFDYVLTGPISSVCAGQYVHGLADSIFRHVAGHQLPVSSAAFSVIFAIGVTLYFWRANVRGIEESSGKALRIMQVTAGMAVVLILWSLITMALRPGGVHLPPLAVVPDPAMREQTLGWLAHVPALATLTPVLILVGFGHSILAMSGEETLAQVYREIEAPKHRNLMRAGLVIFVFSLTFTSFVAFASVMLVPDAIRAHYHDNLLNGLVLSLAGPSALKLAFQTVVVLVGALLLSGAVNTSIIGANGVLNRVAEDGILSDWFRDPQHRYGTSHRIINLIVAMQIFTILASGGHVYTLGEAYAFGVVWSFTFMGLAMLMLRRSYTGERGWKVPLNPRILGREVPLGLGIITLMLASAAVMNLFTKKVATVWGIAFTASLFLVFTVSEVLSRRRAQATAATHSAEGHLEKFILDRCTDLQPDVLGLPAEGRRVLVPLRDPGNLAHLRRVMEEQPPGSAGVVAMTAKVEKGDAAFQHLFTSDEERLFTSVVSLAEKYGARIVPIVVPSNNAWFAIARTAHDLDVDEIVLGRSAALPPDVQMEQMVVTWAMVADGKGKPVIIRILADDQDDVELTL
jgi:amino acid transporter